MRFVGPICVGLCLLGLRADAQDRRFPYEAVVDAEEEFVRSGPGPKYYPTGKLARGDKVTVHRHDPGGWYMIAPPADGFSWIKSEYVQRADGKKGRLTANNVAVYVGSALADERSVYQRMLSKGDTVEILDEVTVDSERGPLSLYKIKPPTREYRWISGKAIVPANGARGKPQPKFKPNLQPSPSINGPIALEVDPNDAAFAPSPFQAEGETEPAPPLKMGEQPPKDGSEDNPLEARREQLRDLDRQFREMIQQEPALWNLATLEQSYQALDGAGDEPAMHSQVQQRLWTMQKYARIQQDYQDFHRLTTETKQRDAQLASMQKQFDGSTASLGSGNIPPTNAVPQPPSGTVPSRPVTGTPRFDGAGIIEKANNPPPGAPPFVLISPDGRLLAYLQAAPGMDLSRVHRQSMGLFGERSYRADLKADLIVIRGMQPVRLRTGP
jgi:uncharacterized protein YgiM (DUF1202 family)